MKKAKKRGVKPGTKRDKYNKTQTRQTMDISDIDALRNELKVAIKLKIKYLTTLLRKI